MRVLAFIMFCLWIMGLINGLAIAWAAFALCGLFLAGSIVGSSRRRREPPGSIVTITNVFLYGYPAFRLSEKVFDPIKNALSNVEGVQLAENFMVTAVHSTIYLSKGKEGLRAVVEVDFPMKNESVIACDQATIELVLSALTAVTEEMAPKAGLVNLGAEFSLL